jgi:hypothetical protein
MFSPREVAELHHEKTQLLGENASLKKGLEFLLGRYFSADGCGLCHVSCPLDEQRKRVVPTMGSDFSAF